MSLESTAANHNADLVIQALENPKYDWRTVRGLARETGLSDEDIEKILGTITGLLVRTWDEDGKPLFTTRAHYDQRQSLGHKILSAIADTVR